MNFLAKLLTAVITNLASKLVGYIGKWFGRHKEQKDRHSENKTKVEDFKNANAEKAKTDFDSLP